LLVSSKDIEFLSFVYKSIKTDKTVISTLKSLKVSDYVVLFLYYLFAFGGLFLGTKYEMKVLGAGLMLMGLVPFIWLATTVKRVEYGRGVKDFWIFTNGISYAIYEKVCMKKKEIFNNNEVTDIDKIIDYVALNELPETRLYRFKQIFPQLFWGTISFITFLSFSFSWTYVDAENIRQNFYPDAWREYFLIASIIIVVFIFPIFYLFLNLVNPQSINKRVLNLLHLIKLNICK
jgi:hypothetical protein